MSTKAVNPVEQQVLELVGNIPDPEIPVLTLSDLGVIRGVLVDDNRVTVDVSPTYSGCPATEFIEASIVNVLTEVGFSNVSTKRVLTPPWTTDWISDAGRDKLRTYGIAPPDEAAESKRALFQHDLEIACPRCQSNDTGRVSEFGSTPCKASYKCNACLEPFEYFKCL